MKSEISSQVYNLFSIIMIKYAILIGGIAFYFFAITSLIDIISTLFFLTFRGLKLHQIFHQTHGWQSWWSRHRQRNQSFRTMCRISRQKNYQRIQRIRKKSWHQRFLSSYHPKTRYFFKLSQFLMPLKTVSVMLMNSLMTPTLKDLPKKKLPPSSWKLSTLITMTTSDSANITFQTNSWRKPPKTLD